MVFALRASAVLLALAASAHAEDVVRFRQWLGGQEAGSTVITRRTVGNLQSVETREVMSLERLGTTIRQELTNTATRSASGALAFTWRLSLSAEPMEGSASWSPASPDRLELRPAQGKPTTVAVPPGGMLWPEDLEARLREAARKQQPMKAVTFAFGLGAWNTLDLRPVGPAPLPGFPDAIRFQGTLQQGAMVSRVESWISPLHGELKQEAELMGIPVLTQRAELPPPVPPSTGTAGFFERTLQPLPPHPLQSWLQDLRLRWEGETRPELPVDGQQAWETSDVLRLRRAAPPTAEEATQPPVRGKISAEDAPFLAPTPLLQYDDPCFQGLLARLRPAEHASRWDLAKAVTRFVFAWIPRKDMSVGFASAQEVCRTGKGDCTEHGVLAIAILRRLGVPARGVVGWVAAGEVLGMHFWVEVKLRDRWIPVDPTFDQAPAGALRIKLSTSDLADLGSLGWEGAAVTLSGGTWVPAGGWSVQASGDSVQGPGLPLLRLPKGTWRVRSGQLDLALGARRWAARAVLHPAPSEMGEARLLMAPGNRQQGWWLPSRGTLLVPFEGDRWLEVSPVAESEAAPLLEALQVRD